MVPGTPKTSDLTFPGPKLGPKTGWGGPARAPPRARRPAFAPAGCLGRACRPPGPRPARLQGSLVGPGPLAARRRLLPLRPSACLPSCYTGGLPLPSDRWHPLSYSRAPPYTEVISGDHIPSSDPAVRRKSAALPDEERRSTKGAKVDDVASTITGDLLMLLHKNFYIPNDVVTMVPKRSDRASLPPLGYLTVSKTSLRVGLRFPPLAELIEILRRCRVCLSQFSYRAMSATVGLIALFRDRGAMLTPENLSRMGRLTSDICKWLDMRTRDPAKSWSSSYFFVRNDWGLLEKWGKMRDLPAPLHVGEEDIMRLLKVPDVEHLLYEVRYLNKYIEEEFLFKVGLSFHPGRSDARMLKPTSKVPEPPVPIDHLQVDPERAQATITQLREDQRASGEKITVLEAENKRSQTLIAEKEAALTSFESSRVIDDFKKSIAFKIIIQDHVQEARDHIYEVEVKALEQQCLDDGFIQGFLKGVRLMQRKTGVEVEGLTPSQASDDFPPGSDGDEIESEL
ncbi:hypothetical protein IEQ34_014007 [Dendrobium chrysotoxum]|uniref:Uncharacterized protein n=1 Tax=Dendrobium chrysotoxum TaxID=161865 RepID=A0AAV7GIR7_DENCH|nr:hypothetical protein IEQ34_014007 [Dendrobium chrysotoxum]